MSKLATHLIDRLADARARLEGRDGPSPRLALVLTLLAAFVVAGGFVCLAVDDTAVAVALPEPSQPAEASHADDDGDEPLDPSALLANVAR